MPVVVAVILPPFIVTVPLSALGLLPPIPLRLPLADTVPPFIIILAFLAAPEPLPLAPIPV